MNPVGWLFQLGLGRTGPFVEVATCMISLLGVRTACSLRVLGGFSADSRRNLDKFPAVFSPPWAIESCRKFLPPDFYPKSVRNLPKRRPDGGQTALRTPKRGQREPKRVPEAPQNDIKTKAYLQNVLNVKKQLRPTIGVASFAPCWFHIRFQIL